MSDSDDFLEILRRDGHIHDPHARLVPLTGGVSSEICIVEDGPDPSARYVVKRALKKLKVKDDWFADVSRNASEWRYIEFVGGILPGSVPKLRYVSEQGGYFAMELLSGDFANWKQLMLQGDGRMDHARMAGRMMSDIHHQSRGNAELHARFDTTANFHQLRMEPYLLTTGQRNPDLEPLFTAEVDRIESTRTALVHGDFSPKNILINGDRMVLLDCEVAWYGDPVFDAAFLLTHLFLKTLLHPECNGIALAFWLTYAPSLPPTESASFESNLVRLLLMLLLARVDGKSPAEYLTASQQQFVRSFTRKHLPGPPHTLSELCTLWHSEISNTTVSGD